MANRSDATGSGSRPQSASAAGQGTERGDRDSGALDAVKALADELAAECRLAEARAADSQRRAAELRAARAAASASSLTLAKASHELRAPLNGIIGLAEVLRHKADAGTIGPAEAGRLAAAIHESGVHLLNLVEASSHGSRSRSRRRRG